MSFNFWAGARAAARTSVEHVEASSVADAVGQLLRAHDDDRFTRVVRASSLLVDGVAVSSTALETTLTGPVTVEVLPPFAGG